MAGVAGVAPHFVDAHDAAYWSGKTRGYDWSKGDRIASAEFNQILWTGLVAEPYPTARSRTDLSHRSNSSIS